MKPTSEQQEAIENFLTGENLKINAYAGTGKTSTLVMMSKAKKSKGLYLAFNKAIVGEAKEKFSSDTTCLTTHSLALKSLATNLKTNEKAFGHNNAASLVEALQLKDQVFGKKLKLTAKTLAFLVLQTLKEFCQGTSREIEPIDLRRFGKLSGMSLEDEMEIALQVGQYADLIWEKMKSPLDNSIALGHDGYLKLWSLSNPKLNYDFVLLDEAQDTNPAVLGVLREQSCQVVYVGDAYQQIYEWRGAINAMDRFEATNTVYLTQSFRFGEEIADAASLVLNFLGAKKPMRGNSKISSRIDHCVPQAILTRTNSAVMSEVIAAINTGKRPCIIGGPKELIRLLKAVSDLKNGIPSDLPEFFGFSDWSEVEELVNDGEADNLMTLVNLVRTHGEKHLLWALRRTEPEEESADLVISTTFKAKGREWNNVKLTDDFFPSIGENADTLAIDPSEARVFYVALTRGRQIVDVDHQILAMFRKPKISWTDKSPIHKQSETAKVIVSCPNCNAKLRVPAGKKGKIRCPSCNAPFETST